VQKINGFLSMENEFRIANRRGTIPINACPTGRSVVVATITLALVICSLVDAKPAFAQVGGDTRFERAESRDLAISGSSHNERVDCRGGTLQVSGSSNRVSAVGPCSGVLVSGSSNQIFVDLLPGSPVDLSGSSNVIEYRIFAGAPDAIVHQSGSNNIVERRP
jgi:Protein of unknown function (DUF3060)